MAERPNSVSPHRVSPHRLSSGPSEPSGAFYIGWQEHAPRPFARKILVTLVALGLLAVALPVTFAALQTPLGNGTFAFGTVESVRGTLVAEPHPRLLTEDGETVYLVAFGKHSASEVAVPLDGQAVVATGTRIERGSTHMLELTDHGLAADRSNSVSAGGGSTDGASTVPSGQTRSLGRHTLTGEIVDSKCWLGVMKPSERKVHRACASLCLRGGIPPLFVVRGPQGDVMGELLLVDPAGAPLPTGDGAALLEFVAEPVRITGEVVEVADRFELRTDLAAAVERVAGR